MILLNIVKKLKLLDEYNHLFSNLEDVKGKVISIKNIKDERVNELSQRDKHFNITNVKINNLDEINKNCNFIINKHNKYLLDISDKVNRMNEKKIVSYKLKGLGDLISSSLKYIGLISLTPFSGVIPGIAVKTAITRRLVSEMIKNIHYEKNERIIYCVHNYISELDGKIYDINSVSKNIDDALNDIEKLKKEFRDYYFKYHLKEYEEVYKKIIKIEEDIIISKKNITTIRNSLLENKGLNQKVLKKVKRLNERNN